MDSWMMVKGMMVNSTSFIVSVSMITPIISP